MAKRPVLGCVSCRFGMRNGTLRAAFQQVFLAFWLKKLCLLAKNSVRFGVKNCTNIARWAVCGYGPVAYGCTPVVALYAGGRAFGRKHSILGPFPASGFNVWEPAFPAFLLTGKSVAALPAPCVASGKWWWQFVIPPPRSLHIRPRRRRICGGGPLQAGACR